jgi:4-aminobutyrate aminotransferase-like enzyme
MQYLFDEDGRRYLDAFGGIATVCCGHCHPDVVEAIVNQAKRIQHSTVLYLNHAIADFVEALASKMPGDLKVFSKEKKFKCFFIRSYFRNVHYCGRLSIMETAVFFSGCFLHKFRHGGK